MGKNILFFLGVLFCLGGCKAGDFKLQAPSADLSSGSTGVSFYHGNFLTMSCSRCHEQDRPISVPIHGNGQDCNSCHQPVDSSTDLKSWNNLATYNHNPTPTSCSGCHETSRPLNHTVNPVNAAMAKSDCIQCHTSTTLWANGAHTHSFSETNCISCHNGITAQGRPNTHTLNGQCSACHNQTSWSNSFNANYTHTNSIIPVSSGNKHPNINQCLNCHSQTSDSVNWSYTTNSSKSLINPKGTCAGCHQGQYNSAHGTLILSVSANCLNCHHTGYRGF